MKKRNRARNVEQATTVGDTGRRKKRADETRERLYQRALQLIVEKGLPSVTVEDITEAADVGKGTFFNYFQSKDQRVELDGGDPSWRIA